VNSYPFFLALTASLLVGGWLCYNGYGFLKTYCLMRRHRFKSDRVRLELVADRSVLETEETDFIARIERWFTDLGLEHVFDFRDKESATSPIVSVWRVAGSRLYISAYPTSWPPHQTEALGVYIRNGAPKRVSVTTDWLMAYFPVRYHSEFGTRVMWSAWPLPFLIGYVWALGVKAGHSFEDPLPVEDHLAELESAYMDHLKNLIGDGLCVSDGPDQYRPSIKSSLLVAANYTPAIARFAIAHRSKQWQQDLDSVRDLLPAEFYEAKWIIPAVQDRVRTGSTAPLTQP